MGTTPDICGLEPVSIKAKSIGTAFGLKRFLRDMIAESKLGSIRALLRYSRED
jgi:hypothetical protein